MSKIWKLIKKLLQAIGRIQSFIILTAVYFAAFLPFAILAPGKKSFFASGWRDVSSATSTLEEARRQ